MSAVRVESSRHVAVWWLPGWRVRSGDQRRTRRHAGGVDPHPGHGPGSRPAQRRRRLGTANTVRTARWADCSAAVCLQPHTLDRSNPGCAHRLLCGGRLGTGSLAAVLFNPPLVCGHSPLRRGRSVVAGGWRAQRQRVTTLPFRRYAARIGCRSLSGTPGGVDPWTGCVCAVGGQLAGARMGATQRHH